MPIGKHNNHFTGIRKTTKFATLKCLFCKKRFYKKMSELKVRKNIPYCSQKCFYEDVKKITPACKNCGNKTKEKRTSFCCKKCWITYKVKNKLGVKNGFWYENGYKILYQYGIKQGKKEHIKVMEDFINRKLKNNEMIHHKNHNRLDNRLENLILLTRGQHSSLHRREEIKNGKSLFGRISNI